MVGNRQKRINRLINDGNLSSNPADLDNVKLIPSYVVGRYEQIKRGFRLKTNGECPCGSGKKFKKCHKQLEEVTPRWDFENERTVIFDPEQNRWISA
jgi:hypothetical protein